MQFRIGAHAVAFFLIASPVTAEVTAEEVLADQLNLLSGFGQVAAETTGVTAQPNGLLVDGFVVRVEDDGNIVEFRIGGIELREVPEGAVHIIYPDRLPITVTSAEPQDELKAMTFTLAFEGMSHIVSGSSDDLTHEVSFDRMELADIETTPANVMPSNLEFTYAFIDFDGRLRLNSGSPVVREGSLNLGNMTLLMKALAEDGDTDFDGLDMLDASVDLSGLKSTFSFIGNTVPEHSLALSFDNFDWRQIMSGEEFENANITMSAEDVDLGYDVAISVDDFDEDVWTALNGGQRINFHVDYSALMFNVDAETPEGRIKSVSSAGQSNMALRFDQTGIAMTAESNDNSASIVLPPMPDVPFTSLDYSIAHSVFDLNVPFLPDADRQPFLFKLGISGVEMAEDLWALFDPDARLPRDPLDFEIDLDGTTRLARNALEEIPGDVPFKETRARLNALRLSVAGAEITASGEAEDTTKGDIPSGIGRLEMQLTGVNTLIDSLIAMGLLTDEDVMPARMGLSLIARPGDGPDTLVSTIEAFEDGTIHANGQRIK